MNKLDANATFGPIDQSSDEWRDCERLIRRFEKAWQNDPPPEIESFLPTEPHTRDAVLLELIHVDLEFRQKRGQDIRLESYLDRFPQLAGQLSSLSLHADSTALGRARARTNQPHSPTSPASNSSKSSAAAAWESSTSLAKPPSSVSSRSK